MNFEKLIDQSESKVVPEMHNEETQLIMQVVYMHEFFYGGTFNFARRYDSMAIQHSFTHAASSAATTSL